MSGRRLTPEFDSSITSASNNRGCYSPPPIYPVSSCASAFMKNGAFCKISNCPSADTDSALCSGVNFMTSQLKRSNSVPININLSDQSIDASSPSTSSSCSDSAPETVTADTSIRCSLEEPEVEKPSEMALFFIGRRHTSAGDASRRRYAIPSPMLARLRNRGIEKLKREADVKRCIENDYADEKFSLAGAVVMGSLDELGIDEAPMNPEARKRTQSLTEPVHVLTNFLASPCSPSPTRVEKQFYSPSMQQVVRGTTLSPASSPSPNRQHSVRSLSPIAARSFSLKRKYDSDTEGYSSPSPAKRIYSSLPSTPSTFASLDRFSKTNHRILESMDQSLSIPSLDSESSSSTARSGYAAYQNATFQNTDAMDEAIAMPAPSLLNSQGPSTDSFDVDMDDTE